MMFALWPEDQAREGAILRAYGSEDFFLALSLVLPEALPSVSFETVSDLIQTLYFRGAVDFHGDEIVGRTALGLGRWVRTSSAKTRWRPR